MNNYVVSIFLERVESSIDQIVTRQHLYMGVHQATSKEEALGKATIAARIEYKGFSVIFYKIIQV